MLCNQRENPSTFIFDKEHILLCFQGRTLLSAFPHTDPLLFHKHGGNTSHLPSASSQANSIQLGAVRMGCSAALGTSHHLPPAHALSPGAALLHCPASASSSQHSPAPGTGTQAPGKSEYGGWHGCKAPWPHTGTAALLFLHGFPSWATSSASHNSHVPSGPLWATSTSRPTLLAPAI